MDLPVIQQLIAFFHGCFVFLFTFFLIIYLCGHIFGERPPKISFQLTVDERRYIPYTGPDPFEPVYYSPEISLTDPHKLPVTSLMSKYGKQVRVKSKKRGLELIATDVQDGAISKSNLELWKWANKIMFCFKSDQHKCHVVSVDGNNLKFQEISGDEIDGHIRTSKETWFEMVTVNTCNDYFYIKTVKNDDTDEEKYLTIRNKGFILSDEPTVESTFSPRSG